MIVKKVPSFPAIFAGALLVGAVFSITFQPDLVQEVGLGNGNDSYPLYVGVMQPLFGDVEIVSGNESLDGLLSSSGMGGMLITIWLILSAMIFGGIMEASGFLARITNALISKAKTPASLVAATAGTCVFTNISASDQYLSIVVPGRMYSDAYDKSQLAPENLSRTLEDAGIVTSVLVPWNTCGAYHASVLGVTTFAYLPFAFFVSSAR